MRFFLFVLLVAFAVCVAFIGCVPGDDDDDDSSADDDDASDDDNDDNDDSDPGFEYPYCEVDYAFVDQWIAQAPLEKKIAQMYVVSVQVVPWFEFGDARRFVQEIGVGGVFLQPGTGIGLNAPWTVENTNHLQQMALETKDPIPLLIVCDQEGGIPQAVNNLTGGTDQPGNMGLGATYDPNSTYQSYGIMGSQLSALGVNNAYAPVLGLMISHEESSMYTRSFGETAEAVVDHARQSVRGFQENLVIAAGKHFPSHSTAMGDEHSMLPVNEESEQAVRTKYFPPFEAAIEFGVDMMMTTHTVYKAWEDTLPTTFSRTLVTDILRDELGFEGLIVTDDMNMGSITLTPWTEHPDVLAIAAGTDLVLDAGADGKALYGMHPDNEVWAYDVQGQIDTVSTAVSLGRIPEEQIDQSVRRILQTKMKYCLFENPYRDSETVEQNLNTPMQIQVSQQLHEKAITLVRDEEGLLPLELEGGRSLHVVSIGPFQSQMYPDAFWGNIAGTSLWMEIQKLRPGTGGSHFDVEPNQSAIDRIVGKAQVSGADLLVLATYHAYYHDGQNNLVNALLALGMPTVMVATALPYDLMAFPQVGTYLATYSNRALAMETAAKALFGLAESTGRLPVSLPGLYDAGHRANP